MPFIILDRDGVINYDSEEYIKSPDEWIPIPGSLEAIAQLNRAGFTVFVATNQSGIARGFYTVETLDTIHEKLMYALAAVGGYVEEIFFCPHHPDEHCACRKPLPGLLQQIEKKYRIDLTKTYFIGDTYADVQAALQAGCPPILILSEKGKQAKEKYAAELIAVPSFDNLNQAVEYILREKNHG